jgi:hypothetical protein
MSERDGGFVTTEKTADGADTVIVTGQGVTVHPCPGGITEDDLVD